MDSRPEPPVVITDPAPGWDTAQYPPHPELTAAIKNGNNKAFPRLTICLPTVQNRAALFALLHAEIKRQAEGRSVEIIVACDNKEISIGKKRQNLLEKATGDYVVYVDDDDFVSPDYVDLILKALESGPDCVGFLIQCTTNGGRPVMAKASMCYRQWGEHQDGFAHTRSIYQKTPVRRELALKAGFPDLRYAEDRAYSAAVMQHVKTEVFIDAVMYFYRFRTEQFMTKYGIKGPWKMPRQPSPPPAERRLSNRPPKSPRFDYKGRRVG